MSTITATPKNKLSQNESVLLDILHRIQKVDPEFPIQYAICLIEISGNEGCSVTSLAEKAGLALSTVSRIIGALSDYRQMGKPYQFIEVKISEQERRKKELYLTDTGRLFLKDILSPLQKTS